MKYLNLTVRNLLSADLYLENPVPEARRRDSRREGRQVLRIRCRAKAILTENPQKEWGGVTEEIEKLIKQAERKCEDKSYRVRRAARILRGNLLKGK